jgi:integration host factor subunit alpha
MHTLTKADLVNALIADSPIKKQDASHFVEAFFTTIGHTLACHQSVKLSGFGHFQLRYKSSRPGFNPKTKASVLITPRCVVTFAASPKLKEQVALVNIDHNGS